MLRKALVLLLLTGVALQGRAAAADSFKPFTLKTLDGPERSLSDILGKATLVVFFYPTCPYCNAAFPYVQKIYDTYKDRGLSMVWINVIPDEEPLIASWRTMHGYTVPVLLGNRSVARNYDLVMTPTHYLLDSHGKVISKNAGYKAGDEKDLERSIQKALGQYPTAVSRSTPHLTFTAAISPAVIEAGARVSIAVDLVPTSGMHLYAPGTQYRPVTVGLQADPLYQVHGLVYPKPTPYVFKPLREEVLVYERPFRLLVEITFAQAEELRARLNGRTRMTLEGHLDYQACDDRVCYLPMSVPFRWTMKVADDVLYPCDERRPCNHSRRRTRRAPVSTDSHTFEAGRADRRQIPIDRRADE